MKVIFINNEIKFLDSFDEIFTSSDTDKIKYTYNKHV